MKTVIRIHRGADFSAKNIGVVELEPPISVPSGSLFFAARLRRSLQDSQPYSGSNISISALFNDDPKFDPLYFRGNYTSGGGVGASGLRASIPVDTRTQTLMCIARGDNRGMLFGNFRPSSSPQLSCALVFGGDGRVGMSVGPSNNNTVVWMSGISSGWNMLAAVYDSSAGTASLHNFTTSDSASASSIPSAPDDLGVSDIGGSVSYTGTSGENYNDIAWVGHWGRVLSVPEMQGVYASAQQSLAASGMSV